LKCEVVLFGQRRVQGRVLAISEGGLAVIADLDLQPGDPIRLMIEPESEAPIKVSGIVGNDHLASPSGRSSRIRKFGCVVSEPTRSFRTLLEALVSRRLAPRPIAIPISLPRPRAVDSRGSDPDLPCSRAFQPPPKPTPEECLPCFKVRLRQIGLSRTRLLTLRARSASQAERIALDELDQIDARPDSWSILQAARLSSG
jgi:hypothetical protein